MSANSIASETEEIPSTESDSLESILVGLGERGVPWETVREFQELLGECAILSLTALQHFADSLSDIAYELFDTSTPIGKLKAKGFVANVRVCRVLPPPPPPPPPPCNV